MPAEITMPQLSDTMTEGTLVKWHKKEGDKVSEGDEIAEVETDKATMPMEAFESGTLAYIAAKEGERVDVGGLIAVIATSGEKTDDIRKQYAGKKTSAKKEPAGRAASAGRAQHVEKAGTGSSSETTRVEAAEGSLEGASSHEVEMGREPLEAGRAQSRRESVREEPEFTSEALAKRAAGFVSERRARVGAARRPPGREDGNGRRHRVRASPLARRIAEDLGVDLSQIDGSGPNGRIVQRDVLEFSQRGPAPKALPAGVGLALGETKVIPLTKMRATIAQRLQQSKQQIPHYYETIDIDVEDLSRLREQMNQRLEEEEGVRLSLADLIGRGVAIALTRHPQLNATFDDKEVTRHGDVNLGIAVALEEGLIVPVLRGVNRLNLREIRQHSADLIDRARKQSLKREEMSGGTFTITNLGTYGIREFIAIINPPEVGILAIGAAEKRPAVRDGQIVPRTMMTVTLSADHRVVDGAVAADFLRTLKTMLENPGMLLV